MNFEEAEIFEFPVELKKSICGDKNKKIKTVKAATKTNIEVHTSKDGNKVELRIIGDSKNIQKAIKKLKELEHNAKKQMVHRTASRLDITPSPTAQRTPIDEHDETTTTDEQEQEAEPEPEQGNTNDNTNVNVVDNLNSINNSNNNNNNNNSIDQNNHNIPINIIPATSTTTKTIDIERQNLMIDDENQNKFNASNSSSTAGTMDRSIESNLNIQPRIMNRNRPELSYNSQLLEEEESQHIPYQPTMDIEQVEKENVHEHENEEEEVEEEEEEQEQEENVEEQEDLINQMHPTSSNDDTITMTISNLSQFTMNSMEQQQQHHLNMNHTSSVDQDAHIRSSMKETFDCDVFYQSNPSNHNNSNNENNDNNNNNVSTIIHKTAEFDIIIDSSINDVNKLNENYNESHACCGIINQESFKNDNQNENEYEHEHEHENVNEHNLGVRITLGKDCKIEQDVINTPIFTADSPILDVDNNEHILPTLHEKSNKHIHSKKELSSLWSYIGVSVIVAGIVYGCYYYYNKKINLKNIQNQTNINSNN